MLQAYQNPSNAVVNIPFIIKSTSEVTLELFDVLGKKVAGTKYTLLNPGNYKEVFDITELESEVYTCVMNTLNGRNKVKFIVGEK